MSQTGLVSLRTLRREGLLTPVHLVKVVSAADVKYVNFLIPEQSSGIFPGNSVLILGKELFFSILLSFVFYYFFSGQLIDFLVYV